MPRFTIRLFGYPCIALDEKPVRLERRKSLALLAYLAVNDGPSKRSGCAREALSAMFWPESSQSQASAYLRQALWEISRAAGKVLIIRDGQRIGLDPASEAWVDVNAFEELVSRWKTTRRDDALSQVDSLYTGDFLSGLSLSGCPEFDNWHSLQSEILRGHLSQVLEALTDLRMRAGDLETASGYARRWLSLDPLNEAAHRAQMRVHIQEGQYTAALRQYEACRKMLADELGIAPAVETQSVLKELNERATAQAVPSTHEAGLSQDTALPGPSARPTGTVTFLFTDIEGSTRLWEQFPGAMPDSFARQEAIIREAVASHNGCVYKMIGDAFQAAFSRAPDALGAALDAQRTLYNADWGEIGMIKVRMALHIGMVEERADDYVGPTLNRVARILTAGYGGQILLNQPAWELIRDNLPDGVTLRDLGECWLKDLSHPEHLYQVLAPGLPEEFPPLKTLHEPTSRLPAPQTPFIGRETELSHIRSLLGNPVCRLVTLAGIGGSGKTRLAIEAARQQCELYSQGACFVELTHVASLAEIIANMAQAVGQVFYTPPVARLAVDAAQRQLFDFLSGKEMLIILDNFEHLIGYASFVSDLLDSAQGVRLMVTSRERINLPGEWVIEVSGLPFPGKRGVEAAAKYASVQLFFQGMERVVGCTPSENDLQAVARICQLLEGMPLGIEMAAAWTKVLSCDEIAAEIEHNVDFLSAGWRGMPERHRTLRAVFEYSWRLLTDQERDTLLHWAVFRGGFGQENAREVAGASLPLLSALVDKSFLRRVSSGRFAIQTVLHPFIAEKLSAEPAVNTLLRSRHAVHYVDWLIKMDVLLKGREQLAALAALRGDLPNLLAAWLYLIEQRDYQHLNDSLAVMILFDVMHDQLIEQAEINRALEKTLDMLQSAPPDPENNDVHRSLLALTLAGLRFFAMQMEQLEQVIAYEQKSMQVIEEMPDSIQKVDAMILHCIGQGRMTPKEKISQATRARDVYDRLGDHWGKTLAQMIIGDQALFGEHDVDTARAAYHSSLAGFAALDNLWGRALCLEGLLFAEIEAKHLDEAYRLGLECLDLLSRLDSRSRASVVNHALGEVSETTGDFDKARVHFQQNLDYFTEIGDLKQRSYYQERLDRVPNPQKE